MRIFDAAAFIAVVAAGCSSGGSNSSGSSSSGAAAGSSCVDYTSCGKGLYCLVSTDAVEGRCETLPAQCAESTECSCLGDALASKCTSRGRCSARVGFAVYSCPQTTRKKEGEACSVARGCEAGLVCRVNASDRAGICQKLPASCASAPSCDCLKVDGCAGGELRECSVVGDEASLVCE